MHCLAGVSRSPTLAIAYIMRCYKMVSEEAYRFVPLLSTLAIVRFHWYRFNARWFYWKKCLGFWLFSASAVTQVHVVNYLVLLTCWKCTQ